NTSLIFHRRHTWKDSFDDERNRHACRCVEFLDTLFNRAGRTANFEEPWHSWVGQNIQESSRNACAIREGIPRIAQLDDRKTCTNGTLFDDGLRRGVPNMLA